MKKIIIFSFIIFSFSVFSVDVFANSFPSFPMSFYGKVYINETPAPQGSMLSAYYNEVLAGEVVIQEDGIYGYVEPTKQKLVIGEGDSEIRFTIKTDNINNGEEIEIEVSEFYPNFISGETILKDLFFYVTEETTSPPQSSSRGGGGGGSSVVIDNIVDEQNIEEGEVRGIYEIEQLPLMQQAVLSVNLLVLEVSQGIESGSISQTEASNILQQIIGILQALMNLINGH